MLSRGFLLLLWIFFIHLAGIYLFTSGFLLTRLALTDATFCPTGSCTVPATHRRAVVLIIDALRFDFVTADPPARPSPFHHNILTLPRILTERHPRKSFLFNAYADPPTTTLQRLKGITTGSLPTFVDLGNNFGGSSIAEDSILNQLGAAGKRAAFMGDDTWISVFPDAFEKNMTFPYDSFDVEDLHTVDEGVISHLFPLLEDRTKPFDFLVGHFLGVDHVGHRVGPDHPSMKAKLEQMNAVLTRVVELLDDDTLLVVLGDHGMDRSGDHGGDGIHETSSALWIYSKGRDLAGPTASIPSGLLQYTTFPETTIPHRLIQQIDLLPTLSLLLGLPIPFNNLGTVIPELFWRDKKGKDLLRSMELNSAQIKAYLDAYRASASGSELDTSWEALQSAWTISQQDQPTLEAKLLTLSNYNRVALSACRSMWAQFNPLMMAFGLALLGIGLIATWSVYSGLSQQKDQWEEWLSSHLYQGLRGIGGGSIIGYLAATSSQSFLEGIDPLDCILFMAPMLSCILVIRSTAPKFDVQSFPLLLFMHTIAFFSNSFTFWEDRIVLFLSVSSLFPFIRAGLSAPTARLRNRILGFSSLFAVCVRLMSMSTVCREEQQPYCHVTFYSSSTLPIPSIFILILAIPTALGIPYMLKRFLKLSMSHFGQAQILLPGVLSPTLVLGAVFWIVEWVDTIGVLDEEWTGVLRIARTWIARLAFGLTLAVGGGLWWILPLCLKVERVEKQVSIIGYANVFGSAYLLLWTIPFGLVYITTQLTGQIILGLASLAILSLLEVVDSVRDVRAMQDAFAASKPSLLLDPASNPVESTPRFSEIVPLALLGLVSFYATGHQSVISSIQWKSAFVVTPTANYVFSPITVLLNSFGPLFLAAFAVPLLGLWNRSPANMNGNSKIMDTGARRSSVIASVGIMMYYTSLLLGTAVSAAILRRHLMVWKVFAPRFMAAVVGLILVDVAVLLGFTIGVRRIGSHVNKLLGRIVS
ncbi:hypothetical protein C8J56DRAFT_971013 [Mycena floridula]|nr:hypothetical protein C8J56DRAFT_971013 [Mycena floridula]